MSSVWKRLQRSNQNASRYAYTAYVRSVQLSVKPPQIGGGYVSSPKRLNLGSKLRSKSSQLLTKSSTGGNNWSPGKLVVQ